MSHVIYFGPKNHFFLCMFLCYHYALIITRLFHDLILLFFKMSLHKSQKISRKWTKTMSKNGYVKTLFNKNARC